MDDVVVVGGGPAGALAALILARGGARVRLFDRARFPRDKLCGDTLNPGALAVLARYLDVAPLVAASSPIDGMLLTGPGGVTVRGVYGAGVYGRAIVRRDLDAWLLQQAAAAGVEIEEGVTITAPLVGTDQAVTGIRLWKASGGQWVFRARMTIAADGRRSRLAFALRLARQPAKPRRWAIGAYFHDVAGVCRVGEMHIRHGHYVGVAPVPGGLTNVCCVTSRKANVDWHSPVEFLRATVNTEPQLEARFAEARQASPVAVLGPMAVDVTVPGTRGLLLAGDAAGFIDPMTGDGLRLALDGAELAGGVALDVLGGRVPAASAASELARRRRRAFRAKWRFNRALRQLVDRPAAVEGAALVARLLPAAFEQMIRYAGDCT